MARMKRAEKLDGEVAVEGMVYMAHAGCDPDRRINPLLDAIRGVCYTDGARVARIAPERKIDRADPRMEIGVRPVA